MTSSNGEREESLLEFLVELSEDLKETTDESGWHRTDSREVISDLSADLQKSLNFLINTRDAKFEVRNVEMEALRASAFRDIDQETTLRHCMLELEKFLCEYPDLGLDLVYRIKNKLEEIKNP